MALEEGRAERDALQPSGCRRATGRRRQEELHCELGPIVDLSRNGMRVLARRRLQGEFDVTLVHYEGKLTLRVRVAWTRRIGLRRYLAGLELLDVDDVTAERLTKISTAHAPMYRLAR